jgi:hypothetical protein
MMHKCIHFGGYEKDFGSLSCPGRILSSPVSEALRLALRAYQVAVKLGQVEKDDP